MKLNKTYSICGYMGVGKTSLIKKVMQKKNFKCLDLDEFIAEKYGPIDIIFESKGESYFREIEQKEYFENLESFDLIALGGGSLENSSIHNHVLSSGSGIYLESSFEELWSRIKDTNRPLVTEGREANYQRFLRRIKLYEDCKFKINENNLDDTFDKLIEIIDKDEN